jgi:hypothetical protein
VNWQTYEVPAKTKGASGSTITTSSFPLFSLFAAVRKHRTNHIPWKEFNNTNLADIIYALAECTSSEGTSVFSRARVNACLSDCALFRCSFAGLDVARIRRYISENLSDCQQCSITISKGLLEDPLFGLHEEMHAAGYVWSNLIVQDQGKAATSLGRWFKILVISGVMDI